MGSLSQGGWASSSDTYGKDKKDASGGATPSFKMDFSVIQHPWKLPMNAHKKNPHEKKQHKVLVRHICLSSQALALPANSWQIRGQCGHFCPIMACPQNQDQHQLLHPSRRIVFSVTLSCPTLWRKFSSSHGAHASLEQPDNLLLSSYLALLRHHIWRWPWPSLSNFVSRHSMVLILWKLPNFLHIVNGKITCSLFCSGSFNSPTLSSNLCQAL